MLADNVSFADVLPAACSAGVLPAAVVSADVLPAACSAGVLPAAVVSVAALPAIVRAFSPAFFLLRLICTPLFFIRTLFLILAQNPLDYKRGIIIRLLHLKVGVAHQALIDLARDLASLADRPDDKGLSSVHIARREHILHAGLIGTLRRCDVGSAV